MDAPPSASLGRRTSVLVLLALPYQDVSLSPVEGIGLSCRNGGRSVPVRNLVSPAGRPLGGTPSKVAAMSSAAATVDRPDLKKLQSAVIVPLEERIYNGEEASHSQETHLRATTDRESVKVPSTEWKQGRPPRTSDLRSNIPMFGLVHLGHHEKDLSFRKRKRECEPPVHPSNCPRQVRETRDQQDTSEPSQSPSQFPVRVSKGSLAERAEKVQLLGCPKAAREFHSTKKDEGTHLRGTRQQRREQQHRKRQLHWQQQRKHGPLSGVEIGAHSSLEGTTKGTDDDDDDDDDDGSDEEQSNSQTRKQNLPTHPTPGPIHPPTMAPPPPAAPALGLPTPLGLAARIVGGAAVKALKLLGG